MGYNYVQPGDAITIPAPAAVSSGDMVIAGAIIGIAAATVTIGEAVDLVTVGVFELPKVGADAFALGAAVYWDDAANLATVTVAGNTKIGVAIAAAGASTGAVKVRLSGF